MKSLQRASSIFGFAAICAIATLTAGCGVPPRTYQFRELVQGSHSNYPISQGRCFKSPEEFTKFSEGVRALGPNCDFPAALPTVDWSREIVIVMFAGNTDSTQRVAFVRASDFAGALTVAWRREDKRSNAVFQNSEDPAIPEARDPTTPFLLGTLPRHAGAVNFIRAQQVDNPF
jgi:hypothetical protein